MSDESDSEETVTIPSGDSEIAWLSDRLIHLSSQLRFMSFGILFMSMLNLALVGIMLTYFSVYRYSENSYNADNNGDRYLLLVVVAATALVLSIAVLALYDSTWRRAKTIFQDLSDIIEKYVGRLTTAESERIGIRAGRHAVREYAASRDLPLTSGRRGMGVYAGVNIACFLVAVGVGAVTII